MYISITMAIKRRRMIKRKRNGRKPKFTRNYRHKNSIVTGNFYNQPGVIPDRLRVKLTYNDQIPRSSSLGAEDIYQFSTNDIFDPNVTASGTQPTGFDQLGNLYTSWRVIASSIRVDFVNLDVDDGLFMCVVPCDSQSTTNLTQLNQAMRLPYAKQGYMGIASGASKCTISNYINNMKLTGDKGYMTDDQYAGGSLTSAQVAPLKKGAWNILARTASTGSAYSYVFNARLTYYVEFYNRVILSLS